MERERALFGVCLFLTLVSVGAFLFGDSPVRWDYRHYASEPFGASEIYSRCRDFLLETIIPLLGAVLGFVGAIVSLVVAFLKSFISEPANLSNNYLIDETQGRLKLFCRREMNGIYRLRDATDSRHAEGGSMCPVPRNASTTVWDAPLPHDLFDPYVECERQYADPLQFLHGANSRPISSLKAAPLAFSKCTTARSSVRNEP